jgi:hypothetical protein
MADRLSIYRGALRLLGDGRLDSLTEDNPRRYKLDDAWQPSVNFLIEQGLWNFAIRTDELSNDANFEPKFGFQYAFSIPDDWVRTSDINREPSFREKFEDFEIEKGFWYADVNPLYVRYVSNGPQYGWNLGRWTQTFVKALEAYLAFECSLPITGNKATRAEGGRLELFQLYQSRVQEARARDAVEEAVRRTPPGRMLRARFNNSSSRRCR